MARPLEYSTEEIIEALRKTRGMIFHAAALIGCTPKTIHDRRRNEPVIADVIDEYRGRMIDTAEDKLHSALDAGEPWAIQMTLKTIGKKRGYVEKQELDVTGLPPISVVRVPSKRPADDSPPPEDE